MKDNGNISGVRSEEEYYMIEAASKMYTRPEVPFEATRWEVNGKTVLEVYIAPSPDKPHSAPDKDDKFKAYIFWQMKCWCLPGRKSINRTGLY